MVRIYSVPDDAFEGSEGSDEEESEEEEEEEQGDEDEEKGWPLGGREKYSHVVPYSAGGLVNDCCGLL